MGRLNWVKMATLPATLLVTIVLTGCGGENGTPAEGKRGPCDLVTSEDLEKMFGKIKIASEIREDDGKFCYFRFEPLSFALIRQAHERARGGTPIEIDGVAAMRLEDGTDCYIDVWPVHGDINQQFTVDAGWSCEDSMKLARHVLNNLPK